MVLLKLNINQVGIYNQLHLHSTMVLLKSEFDSLTSFTYNWSTFHYGSIKITSNFITVIKNVESTFHYGSIKIIIVLELEIAIKWSTFHYGSIKIRADKLFCFEVNGSTFHYGSIKIAWINNTF